MIRKIGSAAVSASVLASASLLLGSLAPCFAADGSEFYDIVRNNFESWDANKDGILSQDEIVKQFQSPNCKGANAAAIAALQQAETGHIMNKEPFDRFTLQQFGEMESKAKNEAKDKFQKHFEENVKRLKGRTNELFASGIPQMDDVAQGKTNDCYLLSVIRSLSQQRPSDLMKMFELNSDGTYLIHFFGTKPERIACLTDAEFASFNKTSDGLWLKIITKAYGKYALREKWNHGDATPVHEDPIEAVAIHGGNCALIIKLLTGHQPDSHKPAEISGDLRKRLKDAFAQHRVVVCGVPGHAMAVVGYDKDSDEIKIWNPWGTSGKFGELNAKMQNGVFSISIREFTQKCNNIMFETSDKAEFDDNSKGKKNQSHRNK